MTSHVRLPFTYRRWPFSDAAAIFQNTKYNLGNHFESEGRQPYFYGSSLAAGAHYPKLLVVAILMRNVRKGRSSKP
jgi:hypothetical protein